MSDPDSCEPICSPHLGEKKTPWWITPLLSSLGLLGAAIGFFVLFCHFANNIELETFAWSSVYTNVVIAASNAPPVAVGVASVALASSVPATSQTQGGHASAFSTSSQGTNAAPSKVKLPVDSLTRELNLRMFWAVSAVVFTALCLVVVIYSIQVIRHGFDGALSDANWVTGICCVVAVIVFLALLKLPSTNGPIPTISGGYAAEQLFEIMGNEQNATNAEVLQLGQKSIPHLHAVRDLASFASVASTLGFAFVGIAAAIVLAVMRKEQDEFANLTPPADNDAAAKKAFSDKADAAKFKYERWVEITVSLLQLTACALVAGVVEIYLLYNLASYYVNPLLQNDVQSFAQGLATISGLMYSALLIAIYLPLVVGQRAIGRELINSHGGDKINGNDTTFVAQLADSDPKKAPMIAAILTVFSPVLIAFLTALASSLTELFSH